MVEIAELFERLCELDPGSLDGRGARAALDDVRRLRGWLDSVEASVLAAGEVSGAFRAVGAVDTAGFLRDEVGLSGREARLRAETASGLAELPATAAALAQGSITFEHAAVVGEGGWCGRCASGRDRGG